MHTYIYVYTCTPTYTYTAVAGHKIRCGQWVHIFPQGRVWQDDKVHKLKWGVGRLVSYADGEYPPIIVPFYHKGYVYYVYIIFNQSI